MTEKLSPGWDLNIKHHATDFVLMRDFCYLQLSKDQRRVLADSYCASTAKKAIEQRLLGLLIYNSNHFPKYSKPGMAYVASIFCVNEFVALVTFSSGTNIMNVSAAELRQNKLYFAL